MSVLENFKNIPRSPYGGDRAQMQFFFQICNEVPGIKKRGACRPPNGRQGGLSPPRATGVAPLYNLQPPLPSSFEPENSTKNPEKREG